MHDELVKRLRECAEVNSLSLYKRGLMKQAADAIEQLSNAGSAYGRGWTLGYDAGRGESKPRWIPVSEKLPEASGHYLIFLECKCDGELLSAWMQVAWFCEKFYWEHLHSEDVFKETITHWMPLPEPPKEE